MEEEKELLKQMIVSNWPHQVLLIRDGHSQNLDGDMSTLCKHIQEYLNENISWHWKVTPYFSTVHFIIIFVPKRFIYQISPLEWIIQTMQFSFPFPKPSHLDDFNAY